MPQCGRRTHTLQLIRGEASARPRGAKRAMRQVLAILREGFDPLIDESSDRELTQMMVLGASSENWDFQNVCAVLLCENQAPVVAAVVRVHGPLMMEVPLIATRRCARRRGHCRVLLDGLAEILVPAGLDQIALPAHNDALTTWIRGFGFQTVAPAELDTVRKHLRMVLFPATTVLKLPADKAARPPPPPALEAAAIAEVAAAESSPVASATTLAAAAWPPSVAAAAVDAPDVAAVGGSCGLQPVRIRPPGGRAAMSVSDTGVDPVAATEHSREEGGPVTPLPRAPPAAQRVRNIRLKRRHPPSANGTDRGAPQPRLTSAPWSSSTLKSRFTSALSLHLSVLVLVERYGPQVGLKYASGPREQPCLIGSYCCHHFVCWPQLQ
jgi:hypothetical protein